MFGRTFNDLSISYRSFSALLDAGQGMPEILKFLHDALKPKEAASVRKLMQLIRAGRTLNQAMAAAGFPRLEVAMMKVGETTGEMTTTTKMLSQYYLERHEIERSFKAALVKPLIMFAISLVTTALPSLIGGKITLLKFGLMTLGPIAFVLVALFYTFRSFRKSVLSPAAETPLDGWLRKIPLVSGFMKQIALERFYTCFLLCIRAGCDFFQTIAVLEEISTHPMLKVTLRSVKQESAAKGFASALARSGFLPQEHVMSLKVGEETGNLEEQLDHLAKDVRFQVQTSIKLINEWAPRVLYALVVIFVVYNIITGFTAQMAPMMKMMGD